MTARPWFVVVFAASCVAYSSQEQINFMDLQKDIKKQLLNAPLLPENDLLEMSVTNSYSNVKDSEAKIMDIYKNNQKQLLQNDEQENNTDSEPDINKINDNDLPSYGTDYDKENLKKLLQKYEHERNTGKQRNTYNIITYKMDTDKNSLKQRLQKYKQKRESGSEHEIDHVNDSDVGKNIRKQQLNLNFYENSYNDSELDEDIKKDIRKQLLNMRLQKSERESNSRSKREVDDAIQTFINNKRTFYGTDNDKENLKQLLQERNVGKQRNTYNAITYKTDIDNNRQKQRLQKYKQKRESGSEHDIDHVNDSDVGKNIRKQQLNLDFYENSYNDAELDEDIKKDIRKQLLNMRLQKNERESNSRSKREVDDAIQTFINNKRTSYGTDNDKENLKQLLQERNTSKQQNTYNAITYKMDIDKNSRKQRLQKYKQKRESGSEHDIDNANDSDVGKNIRKNFYKKSYNDSEFDKKRQNT